MAAMVSFHPLDTTRFGSSTLRRLPKSISNRYKLCLGGGNVGFRLGSIPEIPDFRLGSIPEIRFVKLGLVTDFRLGSIPEIHHWCHVSQLVCRRTTTEVAWEWVILIQGDHKVRNHQ